MEIILNGEVGIDITLYDVVAKVNEAKRNGYPITIKITTIGGSSEEGRFIRDFLKNEAVEIVAVDYVYSAGITILMGSQNRYAESPDVEFLMHSPRFHPEYIHHMLGLDAHDAEQVKKDIDAEKNALADIYSEELSCEKQTILNLMEQDCIIDTQTAKGLGIIKDIKQNIKENTTKPDYKIAAKWYVNNQIENKLKNAMDEKQIKELASKVDEQSNVLSKMYDGVKKLFIPKAIELNSEEGVLLDIDADDIESIVEGETKVNNEVADGTYTILKDDVKYKLTIENQVITAKEAVQEEDVEALKQEIASLKEQLQAKTDDVSAKETELNTITAKFNEFQTEMNKQKDFIEKMKNLQAKYVDDNGELKFNDNRKKDKNDLKSIAGRVREVFENKNN